MMIDKINLASSANDIPDYWQPKTVSTLNNQEVKLARFYGEFTWHKHAREDECFLVLEGSFDMHLRNEVITLNKGELITIPKGVEHKPVAAQPALVLLFEPATTKKRGD